MLPSINRASSAARAQDPANLNVRVCTLPRVHANGCVNEEHTYIAKRFQWLNLRCFVLFCFDLRCVALRCFSVDCCVLYDAILCYRRRLTNLNHWSLCCVALLMPRPLRVFVCFFWCFLVGGRGLLEDTYVVNRLTPPTRVGSKLPHAC